MAYAHLVESQSWATLTFPLETHPLRMRELLHRRSALLSMALQQLQNTAVPQSGEASAPISSMKDRSFNAPGDGSKVLLPLSVVDDDDAAAVGAAAGAASAADVLAAAAGRP